MNSRVKQEGLISVYFYSQDQPVYQELVDRTLSICAEMELAEHPSDSEPLDPEDVTLSDKNRVTVYPEDREITLRFPGDDWDGSINSVLKLSVDATRLVAADRDSAPGYTGPARVFVDLIRRLAVALDPYYVSTFNRAIMDGEIAPTPQAVLPLETPLELKRVPWLGVYSQSLIDRFGGRKRVLDTPAWRVEELDTGSILVITTRIPFKEYNKKQPADRHLLDGIEATDAISPPSGVALSDPFASFDPDEIGTDVCVHRDSIKEEFRNEDLHLVPVRVDVHRNLRHLGTGAFVRNVVTDTAGEKTDIIQRMLADIPATADDDLYVSALLRDVIPPEFVRLDDREDENVVTKVMALDTGVSKIELLVSLGRVAQQDDFTAEDLDSMEGALDTLRELDNTDNIDQYIRNRLL